MSQGVDDEYDCLEDLLEEHNFLDELEDECHICGARLTVGHAANHGELMIEEITKCHSCGSVERKANFKLN